MKLEINVLADSGSDSHDEDDKAEAGSKIVGGVVEKILVKPNDVVSAGQPMVLVRVGK